MEIPTNNVLYGEQSILVFLRASAYRLLEHNCNHFSDEVAQFLCGARVPKHIVAQPEQDLPPPLRMALTAMLDKLVPAGDQVGGAFMLVLIYQLMLRVVMWLRC